MGIWPRLLDLVQVFDGQAARDAAIADGMGRDKAQYLGVYVRNQNPRLRTLALARDLRLDLRGGDCQAPLNHQLTKLANHARSMSGPTHTYYFTLTVRAGAVHQVQEFLAINACSAGRWGRRGAARQRSTTVNHGAPRTIKPAACQP
jgi:hypothetical protein